MCGCLPVCVLLSLSCPSHTLSPCYLPPAVIDTRNVLLRTQRDCSCKGRGEGSAGKKKEGRERERERDLQAFWEKLQHRLHRRFAKLRSRRSCSFAAAYGPWPRAKTSSQDVDVFLVASINQVSLCVCVCACLNRCPTVRACAILSAIKASRKSERDR